MVLKEIHDWTYLLIFSRRKRTWKLKNLQSRSLQGPPRSSRPGAIPPTCHRHDRNLILPSKLLADAKEGNVGMKRLGVYLKTTSLDGLLRVIPILIPCISHQVKHMLYFLLLASCLVFCWFSSCFVGCKQKPLATQPLFFFVGGLHTKHPGNSTPAFRPFFPGRKEGPIGSLGVSRQVAELGGALGRSSEGVWPEF